MVHRKVRRNVSYQHNRPASSAPRPRLSAEDVQNLGDKMRDAFKWDAAPKDFQLEAVKAQIEGVDMIVQAPTGSGKTAIAAGPHYWARNERRFTLMVCPLLSLEEEMETNFEVDYGLHAIALNSKNGACSPLRLKDILDLKYQIILISPEMLQSRTFVDRVLRNSSFMRNIISFFIDEAHCIVHWGADFRKKYGTLGKIRAFLPRGTPVMAVTATLTARVRRGIYSSLHFAQSEAPSRFVNKGNDRSNVSIVVRACEHPLNTYADLDFIIPPNVRQATDIPKTYLYVDNIAVGAEIIDHLNAKIDCHFNIPSSNTPSLPRGIVRPFNATLSQQYRATAMARFRAGDIRILVCTDAAGMGCNIADIDRVVQWKLPSTFSHFIQRAGRAARGRNRTGIAVLLVEKTAYSIDLTSAGSPSQTRKDAKQKASTGAPEKVKKNAREVREYARSHGILRGGSRKLDEIPDGVQPVLNPESADEALLAFVQSTTCRRKVWAEVFESEICQPVVPCCDICDPSLLNHTRPVSATPGQKGKKPKRGLPDLTAQSELQKWRERVYLRDHMCAQYDETAILPDDLVLLLVSHGPISTLQIATFLKEKWAFWDLHGDDLAEYIQSLEIVYTGASTKMRTSSKRAVQESPLETGIHHLTKRSRLHTEQPSSAVEADPSRQTTIPPTPLIVTPRSSYFALPSAQPLSSCAYPSPLPSSAAGYRYPTPSSVAHTSMSQPVSTPSTPMPVQHNTRIADYCPSGPPLSSWTMHASNPVGNLHMRAPDMYHGEGIQSTSSRMVRVPQPHMLYPTTPHNTPPTDLAAYVRRMPVPQRISTSHSVPNHRSSSSNYMSYSLPPTPTPTPSTYYPPPLPAAFLPTSLHPNVLPHPLPPMPMPTAPVPYRYVYTSSSISEYQLQPGP